MTRYRLHLCCPKCDKLSEVVVDKLIPKPRVNCGDCLMDRVEVVEMTIEASEAEEDRSQEVSPEVRDLINRRMR